MTNPSATTEWSESIVASFRNAASALVELHTARFMTHWTYSGPPYAADSPYEVGGWNWRCLGCKAYGREGETYYDPGFRNLPEARSGAQAHAVECRAVPRLAELVGWEYLVESFYEKWMMIEQVLDKRGPQGWELVTVNWASREAVFKRPAGSAA